MGHTRELQPPAACTVVLSGREGDTLKRISSIVLVKAVKGVACGMVLAVHPTSHPGQTHIENGIGNSGWCLGEDSISRESDFPGKKKGQRKMVREVGGEGAKRGALRARIEAQSRRAR
jgi:hypothetical protein